MKKLLLALMLVPAFASAIDLDDDGTWKLTGFYNLTGAKVMSGSSQGSSTPWTYQKYNCPCTIQNWEYTGVYEQSKGWEFDQESLVGLQLKKDFTPNFSGTVQVVSRAQNPNQGSKPTVDWAYLTWQPSTDSNWTIQAGRFRIPLYYYSDYLYIGYAYPWVRPAPDVYGWPIYAYNGANVSYRTQIGDSDWATTATVWAGSFSQNTDAYYTNLYNTTPTSDAWKRILGGSVSVNNGIVDVRGMVMHHYETAIINDPVNGPTYEVNNAGTTIMGLSANMDYKSWLIKTEIDHFSQVDPSQGLNNVYKYALVGVGYNYKGFTPMYTYSRYRTVAQPIEGRDTQTFVLRWDVYKNTTLKIQYDVSKDKSTYPFKFFGDSKLLSVALQGVF